MSRPTPRPRGAIAFGSALATLAASTVLIALPAQAVSPDVVISEVYGGGGNSGSLLKQDFIELYNTSASPVDLAGWSVQYASSTGTFNAKTDLTGSVAPGGYYLIGEGVGAGGTVDLPTTDDAGAIAMSGSGAKVALVTTTTLLTGCGTISGPSCTLDPTTLDLVGWGTTATDFEGARAPATSNPTSITRDATGTDTDSNVADFTLLEPPLPTNTAGETPDYGAEPEPCGGATPVPATISEVQGAGHLSTVADDCVETTGVTTAVSGIGYWIQDPTGDGDPLTSDAVFVFTEAAGVKPAVGDAVTVIGTVSEFRSGSAGLSTTELIDSAFDITAIGQPLPAPVLLGAGGVLPPPDVIDHDSPTRHDVEVPPSTFDPAEDAIDFYEQYEGMLIQLNDPVAVAPTNRFGEIVVKMRGSSGYVRTANGGVVYSSYDSPHPRRLVLDDVLIGAGMMPSVNTGDEVVGSVVGPLDYGFNNWRMYPTSVPATQSGGTTRTSADPARTRQLAVATFNVENLDPNDPQEKFDALAAIVVDNLAAPDIVALEEVQDNNGATNDGTVAADQTLDKFVAAIASAGGPSYEWADIDPVDGADGGEPGGNIRVAFIYRTDRGLSFVQRGEGDATTPTEAITIEGELALTLSPGRVNPQDSAAWAATRKPLAGEFVWRGEKLFVIANHFSSKGGDEPLFGRFQPPDRSSEVRRHLQAASVNEFVQELLDVDPDANIAVVGDLNDFEFSDTVKILTDDGSDLADLIQFLKPKQRYTYVYEGNSQVLDHILVGPSLAPDQGSKSVRTRRDYEVVHVNADFADQVSDHDTQVVRLRFGSGTP